MDEPLAWFADPQKRSNLLRFYAHAGPSKHGWAPPALQIAMLGHFHPERPYPRYGFRVLLPLDQSPEALVQFCQRALAKFPLASGHCGLTLVHDHDPLFDAALTRFRVDALRRHPGLGLAAFERTIDASEWGVAVISWLTLLGPRWAAALPPTPAIPSGVSLAPLGEGGLLLRAGDAPALGDEQDALPLYRAVGRLLAPLAAPAESLALLQVPAADVDLAARWPGRFFP